jgi:hypothetical protein
MKLRRNAMGRRRRITVERLEERTVLNGPNLSGPGFYYDAGAMEAFIVGTDLNDRFLLAADPDGTIRVTHNGKPLPAIDPATNLPSQVDPAVWNTDSILALLRQGDDVFDFFSDRFAELGAVGKWDEAAVKVSGDEGNDTLILRAVEGPQPEPPTFPLSVEFDGGAGLADSLRLVGGSADEKVDIFSMDDFHDITLSYNPAFVKLEALRTERLLADLGRGDDLVIARVERDPIGGPGYYQIDLGDGDDMLDLVGIAAPEDNQPGGPVNFYVSGGAADDVLRLDLSDMGHTPVRVEIIAGLGDDEVGIVTPECFQGLIDLGSGHDLLSLSGQTDLGRLQVRAGAGNDRIDGFLEAVGLIAVPNVAMSFDLEGGDDTFDIALAVMIGAAGQGRVQMDVRGGAGHDTMDAELSISGAGPIGSLPLPVVVGLDAGSGHDEVAAKVDYYSPPSPGVGPNVHLGAVLGTGNDAFDLVAIDPAFPGNVAGATFGLRIDAGAGHDVVDLVGSFHWNVWINLGSGNDVANLVLLAGASSPTPRQVTVLGGAGADEMDVRIDPAGPAGMQDIQLAGQIRLLGGQGNDDLGLFVADNIKGLDLLIDGGLGKNTAAVEGKVRVLRSKATSASAVGKW